MVIYVHCTDTNDFIYVHCADTNMTIFMYTVQEDRDLLHADFYTVETVVFSRQTLNKSQLNKIDRKDDDIDR